MKFIILVFALAASISAYSAQTFRVKDGDTINVKVSAKELTRIAVEGDGKLGDISIASGLIEIQPDTERGEVKIRPLPGAPSHFSFFVTDDLGSTYTVVADQYDVPSETVLLKIDNAKRSKDFEYKTVPYVELVKQLMRGMAINKTPDGFSVDDVNIKVPVWRETQIVMVKTFTGYELLGEVYKIANVSKEPMIFDEREFLEFGKNVKAVALEQLSLDAGSSTFLYVVRSKGGQ